MSVISFIVESLICSGLFLVLYRWILAKKVGFRLCRTYLTVTMLLSVIIPIMEVPVYPSEQISAFSEWTVFSFDDFNASVSEGTSMASEGQTAEITEANTNETDSRMTAISLRTALSILYVLIGLISLSLLVYNTIKIYRLRSKSKLTYEEDYTLAEHEDIKTPFSFIMTIFIGFNYETQERRQIITHEASHVRHRHSYERLFMSVLRSIFWFNPFLWMAEKDLEEVQEWEADKDVLDEGWNLKTYRTTIFKQLFGYNPDITCGLNHSLTKQRFIMMTQSHRGKGAWIRLAATLPVIAATFFAFGCGTKQAEITDKVSMDSTNGTEATYIDMCPPCDATVGNAFTAGRAERSHTGIDYVLNEGEPVYAAADGEVSAITRDESNGLMLTLKHSDGYETRYAHLSKVNICTELSIESSDTKVNRTFQIITDADHSDQTITGKVKKGQLIGYAGSTGRATGSHLHFEVCQNGKSIDPAPLFTSDKLIKAPLHIFVIKDDDKSVIICNGRRIEVNEIGQIVAEYFAGEEMYNANVSISADNDVPMGIITDIKMQLRNARALKVRYETDDSAIEKRLPPALQNTEKESYEPRYQTEFANDISRRNLIMFYINHQDKVLLGTDSSVRDASDKPYIVNIEDFDVNILKRMISNPDDKVTYPEQEMHDITMPDGSTKQFRVSKAMISFRSDRGTSYEGYTKAMEYITTAYKELREEVSSEVFGKPLAELTDAEMQVIYRAVPMNVSEAEPKDVSASNR